MARLTRDPRAAMRDHLGIMSRAPKGSEGERTARTEVGRVRFVEGGSPEWDRMWSHVCDDRGDEDPESGEVWQYMGTQLTSRALLDMRTELVHYFRHRRHPDDGERRSLGVPGSTLLSWASEG